MCARRIGSETFFELHPFCCFCGGAVAATTVEHAPPKVLFKDKMRLKGLEFPACERCNHGSAQKDQVAALFCLTMGTVINKDLQGEYWERILLGVQNNNPEVISYLAERGEEFFWDIGNGQELAIKTPLNKRLFDDWLNPWAAKQAFAIWYEHSGSPVGSDVCVSIDWIPNEYLYENGIPDDLIEITPYYNHLKNGKKVSFDQFIYRYNVDVVEKIGLVLIGLHEGAVAAALFQPKTIYKDKYRTRKRGSVFSTSPETGIVSWTPFETGFVALDI